MASRYEVWLVDHVGTRLALLDTYSQFEYAKVTNDAGAFSVTLPGSFDDTLLAVDRRIEFWRGWDGGGLYLDFTGFIRHLTYVDDESGRETIEVAGPGLLDLLRRRIVAYDAGSTGAVKAGAADNIIRDFVRENLGTGAEASRQLSSTYFSVEANSTGLPSPVDVWLPTTNSEPTTTTLRSSLDLAGADLTVEYQQDAGRAWWAVGDTFLIDAEQMLIGTYYLDWASVTRAQGGTALAFHDVDAVVHRSFLTVAVNSSTTTIPVGRAALYAVGDGLLIDTEQLLVTAVGSTSITATRGVNGTTAATHVVSTIIYLLAISAAVEASGQNLLEVVQGVADMVRARGIEIVYDVVPVTTTTFQFRVYVGQTGADHSWPYGQNPVLLGKQFGNLAAPVHEVDWTDEANTLYVRGDGDGFGVSSATVLGIVLTSDATRQGQSIWSRTEALVDAGEALSRAEMDDVGRKALAASRRRLRFSCQIVETDGTRYGRDWRQSDRVTATNRGRYYTGYVRMVHVAMDGNGKEIIDAAFEVSV